MTVMRTTKFRYGLVSDTGPASSVSHTYTIGL